MRKRSSSGLRSRKVIRRKWTRLLARSSSRQGPGRAQLNARMGRISGQDGNMLEIHILVSGTDKSLNDTILVRTRLRGQKTPGETIEPIGFRYHCASATNIVLVTAVGRGEGGILPGRQRPTSSATSHRIPNLLLPTSAFLLTSSFQFLVSTINLAPCTLLV